MNEPVHFFGEIDYNTPIELIDCEGPVPNINLNLEDQTLSKSNNSSSNININSPFAANILSNNDLQNNVDNCHLTMNFDLSVDQMLIEVNDNVSSTEQTLDKFSTLNEPHENIVSNNLTNNVKEMCDN